MDNLARQNSAWIERVKSRLLQGSGVGDIALKECAKQFSTVSASQGVGS